MFFDIDTNIDNASNFAKSSKSHWNVWDLNHCASNLNQKDRYFETNRKDRNWKTMKILLLSISVVLAKQTSQSSLISRRFHKKIRVQILEDLSWTLCWKQMKISLRDSCRFWRDDIEFNIEMKKTRFFVNELNMISQCFRRRRMISIMNWRIDLRFEFRMLLILSQILKSQNWFAESINVIFENFRTKRIARILIDDERFWKFYWNVDWFSNSIIVTISVARERNRFMKINRYVLELTFE